MNFVRKSDQYNPSLLLFDVDYNEEKKAWVVDLKHGEQHLTTHLEPEDVDACIEGVECVYLGTQIAQLADNVRRRT